MTMMTTTASPELARLAAAGDEVAFKRLVDAHHEEVLSLCVTITRDPDLAAEAAQASWIRVWQGLSSLRDPERVHGWLCTIAANEARGLLRRRRRVTVLPLDVAAELPDRNGDAGIATFDIDLARPSGAWIPRIARCLASGMWPGSTQLNWGAPSA
jgi:DNA-directed RNA polymerase specialized sigma24 family protein